MALIDVSFLLKDPDFCDNIQIINRDSSVNQYGEHVLTESAPIDAVAVIQPAPSEALARLPDGTKLKDAIVIYYAGILTVEGENGYSDIIITRGNRYTLHKEPEDFLNYGGGFVVAYGVLEKVNNRV
jgi:hypothetical protein